MEHSPSQSRADKVPPLTGLALYQTGQAIVLILLLTVAAVLVGLSLLNTGILTSEKMQLQNAADATAYSVSTIEARDLNFAAYTNRAMIANEVALGQMVGLLSHASMVKTIPGWWKVNFIKFYGTPYIGQVLAAMGNVLKIVFLPLGNALEKGVKTVGNAVSSAVYPFNKLISVSQRTFNIGSLLFTGPMLFKVPKLNAEGARHAPFGFLAMGFHLLSHYPDFTPRKIFKQGPFISSYRQDNDRRKFPDIRPLLGGQFTDKAKTNTQKEGMARLAAMVNASRDPYSLHRQCGTDVKFPWKNDCVPFTRNRPDGVNPTGGVEKFKAGLPIPPIDISNLIIPYPPTALRLTLFFDFGIDRHGGTDMRFKELPLDKTNRYVWSATDQLSMGFKLIAQVDVCIFNPLTLECTWLPLPGIDVSPNTPLAVGGAQSSVLKNQFTAFDNTKTLNLDPFPPGGRVQPGSYGGNPGLSSSAWGLKNLPPFIHMLIAPTALPPSIAVTKNNLYKKYEGLPRYNDSKRGPDPIKIDKNLSFGWNSPYFLVSLEKDLAGKRRLIGKEGVRQSNDLLGLEDKDKDVNSFYLDPNAAADKLSVLAKSEVYFSRPNDLRYFMRAYKRTELANAFNPFWDARLVDTTYIDRITALAINQRQLWVPQDFTAVLTSLQGLFQAIMGLRP